jgi:hypothetical protein
MSRGNDSIRITNGAEVSHGHGERDSLRTNCGIALGDACGLSWT